MKSLRVIVIQMKKSYYWSLVALLVVGLFWFTDVLSVVDIPVVGVAPYYHGNLSQPRMSITVNVDWGEEYIPLMLEIFKQKNVKVTFFVTGKWTAKFPDLVKRISDDGHEIGNHGYSHVHPNELSRQGLVQHIEKAEQTIYDTIGVRTNLYAPPYGEYNKQVVETADQIGYKLIMWTADTIDWQRPSPEVILNRVIKKASKGGIVLMHPIQQTVQALPTMIERLKEKGYQLVPISENLSIPSAGESDGS